MILSWLLPGHRAWLVFASTSALVLWLGASPSSFALEVPQAEPGQRWAFRGTVSPVADDNRLGEPAKAFDLSIIVADHTAPAQRQLWFLTENGQGGWPWIERSGRWQADAAGQFPSAGGPALLCDRGETSTVVPLPPIWLVTPGAMAVGSKFHFFDRDWEVVGQVEIEGRATWECAAHDPLGLDGRLWLDQQTPLVLRFTQRVFQGQGEEFELACSLVSRGQLNATELADAEGQFAAVDELRHAIDRTPRSRQREFTPRQLATLAERVPLLLARHPRGPLVELLRAAVSDVTRQTELAAELARQTAEFEGRAIEMFQAERLADTPVDLSHLRGKVTVLHFWDYRDEPLSEPYGQVGYLEFLYGRRQPQGVQVWGVAVNGSLGEPDQRRAAVRSVAKLKTFMNLSYPILLDPGPLVAQFGDPRPAGGALPLFVVIGPDLKIVHYRVGCYPVDANAGLVELDAAVGRAVLSSAAAP